MFEGLRVLDFTRVLAGPYCTAMLADLGADVVKVEPPGGDDQRHMGVMRDGRSANFALVNRSKRSLRIDLSTAAGQALARSLAATSDVLVENFKPGVASRLGIGPERLCPKHPRLVYCSISGFGQRGPNAARPAYDVVVQAASGLMNITGDPAGPPTLVGESVADISAGIFAAWGIAAALFARERTGQGRHLDVAMFDALFAMQPTALAQYLYAGVEPRRVGNRHPLSSPFGAYAAADGHFMLAAANDKLFAAVAEVIGRPELAVDARFASDAARCANDAALRSHIEQWSRLRSVADAVAAFEARQVPCTAIAGTGQVVQGDQVAERGLLRDVQHPYWGPSRVATQPVRFAPSAPTAVRAAPELGGDSDEVLQQWLGMDPCAIDGLRADRVI